MRSLNQAEAESLLEPHMLNISAPVYAAWRDWEALPPEDRRPLTPRTRANWLFDHTVDHAKTTLDRPPTYTLTEQPGFLVVTVEDRVAIRYKKLDEELGISGIRTGQFRLWHEQIPLDGLHGLTHLVAGYQVTEFGRLSGVMVVCMKGYRVLWHLDAPPAPSQVVTFPTPSEPPATRVLPKDGRIRHTDIERGDA
jgi:hypothetical protein